MVHAKFIDTTGKKIHTDKTTNEGELGKVKKRTLMPPRDL